MQLNHCNIQSLFGFLFASTVNWLQLSNILIEIWLKKSYSICYCQIDDHGKPFSKKKSAWLEEVLYDKITTVIHSFSILLIMLNAN